MADKKRPGPKVEGAEQFDSTLPPPALFIHCVRTYNKMLERATNSIISPVEPNNDMIIYEGFFVRLVAELGLSTPYFSYCRQALIDMGCIRQIKRGGGTGKSQWELIRVPTEELFDMATPRDPNVEKKQRGGEIAMLKDQIATINARVLALEDWKDNG